jgi:pimeloyl-ACP methyl ester carboxylesterase
MTNKNGQMSTTLKPILSSIELLPKHILSYYLINDGTSRRPVIFLHGIMGSKRNLLGFAQKFTQRFPQFSAYIFDLPNHGESTKHWPPYTVAACAEDILLAMNMLSVLPVAIIGHSFSGKLAALLLGKLKNLQQIWMLDCPPGPIDKDGDAKSRGSLNTLEIIQLLKDINWPVASRRALVEKLIGQGVSEKIASWMSTNLAGDGEEVRLIFEPTEIEEMLRDFIALDTWPLLEGFSFPCKIHLLAAEFGERVTSDDKKQLEQKLNKNGYFHLLRGAGHFVHADNPLGLLDIMQPYFS